MFGSFVRSCERNHREISRGIRKKNGTNFSQITRRIPGRVFEHFSEGTSKEVNEMYSKGFPKESFDELLVAL